MVKPLKYIRWDKAAAESFKAAIEYIGADSIKNAEKVRLEIVLKTNNLIAHPEKYPLDKYKINNDGSYRAFELYRYRIIYRVLQTQVKIIAIRHTSMNPTEY